LISGLFGFVLGDLFLFEAFVEIGSRISLLIMSASPPITALAGFLFMREKLSIFALIGMTLNMLGISLVILSRGADEKKVEFNRPVKGIIFACLGALGQAAGLIFSKIGMGSYNPLAATQIRIIAAVIGYTIIITWRNRWQEIKDSFKNKKALMQIAAGSVTGPYIGVVLSLVALQHTAAGIVSSITSISPIIIIPASIVIFKEKILPKEILGAFISIAGVMLLFL
jgi:drug/metabolite transporter (DMT)-like permease